MRSRTLALVALLPAILGCRATPDLPPPPRALGSFPVTLTAGMDPVVEGADDPLGRLDPVTPAALTPGPVLFVHCTVVALPRAIAERAFGVDGGPFALQVDADEVQRTLAALAGAGRDAVVVEVSLSLQHEQSGAVTVQNQIAYIAGFDVSRVEQVAIADPRVAVAVEGVILLARPHVVGDDRVRIEVEVVERTLELRTRELELGGATSPVTIQVPERLAMRLATDGELPIGDTLLVGTLSSPERDEVILAALKAEWSDLPEDRAR